MNETRMGRLKGENLKTECSFSGKEMEFGKPVRLPNIRKISTNTGNTPATNLSGRSLQTKEGKYIRKSNKQLQLLDQTLNDMTRLQQTRLLEQLQQTQMLTLQEVQLCRCFPRIVHANPLVSRDLSIESLGRVNSQKNISKSEAFECLKDYKVGSVIGRGSCAIVRVCKNTEGKKYAVKTYSNLKGLDQDRKTNLEREISILKQLDHPNILVFVEAINGEDSMHIISELLENVSLADYIKNQPSKKFSEEISARIVRQIGKAFQYLHGRNIVHRDIKLENILVSRERKVKIIDFGFSLQLSKQNNILYDFCGTPHYIAPEVVLKEGYTGKPADIWSLGVLLYRMVVGVFPFKGMNEKALFVKVLKCDLKVPSELSQPLKTLLVKMLHYDPKKRVAIDEVMQSDWLA